MHTLGLNFNKTEFEKIMVALLFGFMEVTAMILFFCILFDYRIF